MSTDKEPMIFKMPLLHLRRHIRESLATTSLKGVARIFKSDKVIVKGIWFVGVVFLLATSVYSMFDVVCEYLSYSYTTNIRDAYISRLDAGCELENMVPLDATVCNVNPFKYKYRDHLSEKDKAALGDFHKFVKEQTDRDDVSQTFKRILHSRAFLLQYLGIERTINMSYSKHDMIMNCNLLYMDQQTGATGTIPCDQDIKLTIMAENYACYTVSLNKTRYKQFESMPKVFGMEVVLFVNNIIDDIDIPFDADVFHSQSSGSIVYVHEHNTLPTETQPYSVSPGTHTQIRVRPQVRIRLGEPHGKCYDTNQLVEDGTFIYGLDNQTYRPVGVCLDICVQRKIRDKCKCYPIEFIKFYQSPNWTEVPFCFSVDYGTEKWMNMTTCLQQEMNSILRSCTIVCDSACVQFGFMGEISSVMWPVKGQQVAFYEDIIKGQPFEDEFQIYSTISKLASSGNKTTAKQLLRQTNLIEENFVKISVYATTENLVILEDKPKMTITDLFASVGGTLNLYSGISFILVIEIIDLLYKLLFDCPAKQREKKIHVIPTL